MSPTWPFLGRMSFVKKTPICNHDICLGWQGKRKSVVRPKHAHPGVHTWVPHSTWHTLNMHTQSFRMHEIRNNIVTGSCENTLSACTVNATQHRIRLDAGPAAVLDHWTQRTALRNKTIVIQRCESMHTSRWAAIKLYFQYFETLWQFWQGHRVVGVDNLSRGSSKAVAEFAKFRGFVFVEINLGDAAAVSALIRTYSSAAAVMHFAALAFVPESK